MIIITEFPMFRASMIVGVREAHVAPIPTHNGVMALTLSALARKASASAAHWIVFAAILRGCVSTTRETNDYENE